MDPDPKAKVKADLDLQPRVVLVIGSTTIKFKILAAELQGSILFPAMVF